ncbi:Eco47II family restriction endonuclease [Mycoplasma sp. 1654_15]|uniref:Eco47II family restriction endonuclease n=1 Tax=Mycoplasma sp. 1654_15 TaxID=2725994 RepID=UPI0020C4B154|nr:Eco47II family restriction endonuclease [Mycoplasma sp. 1654_15]
MEEFVLDFISKENFEKHLLNTIHFYKKSLENIDFKKFNSNKIDPIKLVLDKYIFQKSYKEIISLEIHRQKDKTNNNLLGYFHQNIFHYFENCSVPKQGWDIICKVSKNTYFVELKNKHNTMNSFGTIKTYLNMKNALLKNNNNNNNIYALVEVIAKKSQNIPWIISIDDSKQEINEQIRRISIDRFYHLVTGDAYAFSKLCKQFLITLKELLIKNKITSKLKNTKQQDIIDFSISDAELENNLFKIAFSTYLGFNKNED